MGDVPRHEPVAMEVGRAPHWLGSGRLWWAPASLVVAWLIGIVTPLPPWLTLAYAGGNVVGTAVALRLEVARLGEWGDAKRDHRRLLRWLCIAQVPTGWGTFALMLIGAS